MSKKNDLSTLFKGYKQQYEKLQVAIKEVRSSTLLTEEGKTQEIQNLIENFTPTVNQYHEAAASILDDGIQALSSQWKTNSMSKLTDVNYQVGLSNVLKMIESGGISRKEDMQAIIDTYRGDSMAISAIRNVIPEQASDKDNAVEWSSVLPKDNRDYNMKLLEQLKGNVDNYMNVSRLNDHAAGIEDSFNDASVSLSMESMSEFVEGRFTDDFSLIE